MRKSPLMSPILLFSPHLHIQMSLECFSHFTSYCCKKLKVSLFVFLAKTGAGPLPKVLQVVKLPIMSNEKCRQMYMKAGFEKRIPPTALCAGYAEGGKDSCEGDSGGPLMVWSQPRAAWVLAGIVSNGIRCAEPNLPGVYVRITEYLDWIQQHTL